MSTEQNKATARRIYEECFSKGNFAAVDEIFDANFADRDPLPGVPVGPEGFKQIVTMFRTSFPNLRFTVQDMIADGDKVVVRYGATGTDTGGFMGMPPTGRRGIIGGIDILRFESGKLVERWGQLDLLGLMQQLGLIPAPGH